MYYDSYLALLSQLHKQIDIKIVVEDVEIFIDTGSKESEWCLVTKIFTSKDGVSKDVQERLSSLNLFRLQKRGPYLSLDQEKGCVSLVCDCVPMVSFKQFRSTLQEYLGFYNLWSEFLVSA